MPRSSPGWPSPVPRPDHALPPNPGSRHSGGIPWPIDGLEHDGASPSIQRASRCRNRPATSASTISSRQAAPGKGGAQFNIARRAGLGQLQRIDRHRERSSPEASSTCAAGGAPDHGIVNCPTSTAVPSTATTTASPAATSWPCSPR